MLCRPWLRKGEPLKSSLRCLCNGDCRLVKTTQRHNDEVMEMLGSFSQNSADLQFHTFSSSFHIISLMDLMDDRSFSW